MKSLEYFSPNNYHFKQDVQKLVGSVRISKCETHCNLSTVCQRSKNYGQDIEVDKVLKLCFTTLQELYIG